MSEYVDEACCENCFHCEVHGYRPGRYVNTISWYCEEKKEHVGPHGKCKSWEHGDPWAEAKERAREICEKTTGTR